MPREYIEEEGLKYVWVDDTTVTRAGRTFKRKGHYRIIAPKEYVPNGRRRELSEAHKRKIAESLRKAPNGRRRLEERSSRYAELSESEKR